MTRTTLSRRKLFASRSMRAESCQWRRGRARASASREQNLVNEEIIRKWYAAWENKDLGQHSVPWLADNFTLFQRGKRSWRRPHQQEHAFKSQ